MKAKHFILIFIVSFTFFYIGWSIKFQTIIFYYWDIDREWIGFHTMMLLFYAGCIGVIKMVEELFKRN